MTIYPDRASFGTIAMLWAREPETFPLVDKLGGRPLTADTTDEAKMAMFDELVTAVLYRKFERDGETVLLIPGGTSGNENPEDDQRDGITRINGEWVPTINGRIAPQNYIKFRRIDLVRGIRSDLQSSGISLNQRPRTLHALAGVPFSAYSDTLQYGVQLLTISRDDFAIWCADRGWPFPNFWHRSDEATKTDERDSNESYPDKVRRVVDELVSEHRWTITRAQSHVARFAHTPNGVTPGKPRTFGGIQTAYKRGASE